MKGPAYLLSVFIVVVAIVLGWRECNREPEAVAPVPAEQQRQRVYNPEVIKSARDKKVRDSLIAKIKTDSATIALWKGKYQAIAQKSRGAVIQYRNRPTLENCDTAVTLLQIQVDTLEAGVVKFEKTIKDHKLLIASQAGTIVRKDSVLADLNTGWQECNEREAELQKKNAKKWGVGVQIGYGLTPTGHGPTISIGVQRNLFRF